MEIIIRDNIFEIIKPGRNQLIALRLLDNMDIDRDVILHYKDAKLLFHYNSNNVDKSHGIDMLPVYYETNDLFVTVINNMLTIRNIHKDHIRDYTLVNLNLI